MEAALGGSAEGEEGQGWVGKIQCETLKASTCLLANQVCMPEKIGAVCAGETAWRRQAPDLSGRWERDSTQTLEERVAYIQAHGHDLATAEAKVGVLLSCRMPISVDAQVRQKKQHHFTGHAHACVQA